MASPTDDLELSGLASYKVNPSGQQLSWKSQVQEGSPKRSPRKGVEHLPDIQNNSMQGIATGKYKVDLHGQAIPDGFGLSHWHTTFDTGRDDFLNCPKSLPGAMGGPCSVQKAVHCYGPELVNVPWVRCLG